MPPNSSNHINMYYIITLRILCVYESITFHCCIIFTTRYLKCFYKLDFGLFKKILIFSRLLGCSFQWRWQLWCYRKNLYLESNFIESRLCLLIFILGKSLHLFTHLQEGDHNSHPTVFFMKTIWHIGAVLQRQNWV